MVYQAGRTDVYYGCPRHRKGLCSQVARVPRQKGEKAVVSLLQAEILGKPDLIQTVMEAMKQRYHELTAKLPAEVEAKKVEQVRLEKELKNIVSVIAQRGMESGVLVDKVQETEAQLASLRKDLQEAAHVTSGQFALPTMEWVMSLLADLRSVLQEDTPRAAQLLRRLIREIKVREVRIPGKRRGYTELRLHLDGWNLARELVEALPGHLLLDQPNGAMDRTVCVALGSPSRMDQWAPKIAEMRAQGVKWKRIGEISGLRVGNAYDAWKRWTDAQKTEAAKETA